MLYNKKIQRAQLTIIHAYILMQGYLDFSFHQKSTLVYFMFVCGAKIQIFEKNCEFVLQTKQKKFLRLPKKND